MVHRCINIVAALRAARAQTCCGEESLVILHFEHSDVIEIHILHGLPHILQVGNNYDYEAHAIMMLNEVPSTASI